MSDRHSEDLLADLEELAIEAVGYTNEWTQAAFLRDKAKQRALERTLELMGEVANRLAERSPPGVDWKGLRDLRILLAHAYHRIDARRLWVHATTDVPKLLKALQDSR